MNHITLNEFIKCDLCDNVTENMISFIHKDTTQSENVPTKDGYKMAILGGFLRQMCNIAITVNLLWIT